MAVVSSIIAAGAAIGGAVASGAAAVGTGLAAVGTAATGGLATGLGAGLIGGGIVAKGAMGILGMFQGGQKGGGGGQLALPAPPAIDYAAERAKENIDKRRRSIARNETVFTNPLGLTAEEKSQTTKKTLLGA